MVKQAQRHAEMDTTQARMRCYVMKHTKLVCVIYTSSVLTMRGMTKASKNSGMPQQNNHKYKLRYGQQTLSKDART